MKNSVSSPNQNRRDSVTSWVLEEIEKEQNEQVRLLKSDTKMHHNTLFIVGALLANIIGASLLPDYMVYWITATFFLYVLSPFIMLIPTEKKEVMFPPKKNLEQYLEFIKSRGISSNTKTLGHILWNTFFINSQPLSIAFCLIYSVDIIFALITGFFTLSLPIGVAILVILQSLAIMIYYAGIWKYRPYSLQFVDSVFKFHERIKIRLKDAWKVILLIGGISAAISILIVTAMILPGFTLGQVVMAPNVVNGVSALPIALIFLSQLVIVRYLQGVYSKEMVLSLSEKKVNILKNEILPSLGKCKFIDSSDMTPEKYLEKFGDLKRLYVQSRMYTQKFHHLFGYLPVYLVVPDFKLILDSETLAMLDSIVTAEEPI